MQTSTLSKIRVQDPDPSDRIAALRALTHQMKIKVDQQSEMLQAMTQQLSGLLGTIKASHF